MPSKNTIQGPPARQMDRANMAANNMTVRERMATSIMSGLMAREDCELDLEVCARFAAKGADELLVALRK